MHVRVCVECGEEYRPEIVTCADCGGRLEDRHDDGDRTVVAEPEVRGPHPDAGFTETVVHAKAATDLTEEADRLIEAGIDVRVRPEPEGGYGLLVTAADADRALAVLGLLPADGGHGAQDTDRPCPACGVRVEPGTVDCPECGLAVGDERE